MRDMRVNRDPDEWWESIEPVKKVFFRNMLQLARLLMEGEVLGISFTGRGFKPVFKSLRHSTTVQDTRDEEKLKPMPLEPEVWWSGLSGPERIFVAELGGVFQLLERDRDQYLEI